MSGVKRLATIAGLLVLSLAPASAAHSATVERGAVAPSSQDKQFLQAIHQVNLTEIAAGNLAQQKGNNQQVKDLGARFVTDHTQLDQTVQNTAKSVGVSLPNAPNADQQAVLKQLRGVSGSTFDTQWVSSELTMHAQAMQLIQSEISQGADTTVKQVAQDALPVIQAHHEALVALAQRLGVTVPGTPGPSASGSPTPGTPRPGTSSPGTPGPTNTGPGNTGTPGPTGTPETPGPTGTVTAPGPAVS
ncbi:hypothetical protein GCM10027290_37900 [Micromonospora sonneratiae]|jgi:predicted outer membrane protein|uniref:DUF4142 domain-containing protein n=1 Tax=Micromonospora sonneratiae TaxID=1184706 RepID=A0ABW3Y7V7_9ACTN